MDWVAYTKHLAKKYNLPYLPAQVKQESGYNPNARSGAGAMGIAQIMPGTAAGWHVDPMDPRAALDAMASHMAQYQKQYGSARNALIAYNAGPGAVGNKNLPSETQNYIKTVLGAVGSSQAPVSSNVSRIASSTGQSLGTTPASPAQPSVFDVIRNYRAATQPQLGSQPSNLLSNPYDPTAASQQIQDTVARIKNIRNTDSPHTDFQPATSNNAILTPEPVTSGKGEVIVAPTANRKGVNLQPGILGFVKQISGLSGRPVEITTGTNHNRMTTSGNVSDHWDGNAADLGVGGDARQDKTAGRKGDLIAAHAIQAATGMEWTKALSMAVQGGLWNFPTKAGRIQIIWRTLTGGNHYNHVHVGLNPHG